MANLALFGAFLALIFSIVNAADWSYEGANGPPFWKDDYPICGHNSQSPVDISTSNAEVDTSYGPITFSGYDTATGNFRLKNTGHSIQVDVAGTTIQVSGGRLPATFTLAQFHMHWGSDNSKGSEHLVDGKQYPMEIHFVHYNVKYPDLGTAVDKADGLAVVGVFVEVGKSNTAFQTIVSSLSNVQFGSTNTSIQAFALNGLLPADKAGYFRYSGSLTTPACYESVTWTVLGSRLEISQAQMDAFRSGLYEGSTTSSRLMVNNYRPAQSINGRTIYSSTEVNAGNHVTGHVASLLLPLAALLFKYLF